MSKLTAEKHHEQAQLGAHSDPAVSNENIVNDKGTRDVTEDTPAYCWSTGGSAWH